MAATHVQAMPHFQPKSDPTNTSTRWSQWLERFEQYLKATNITANARKRALLLYQAGPEVYDIFKTIPNTGADDAYDTAVQKLTEFFEPDKNQIYQTYVFRQTIQGSTETLDAYHTKLRGLAKFCAFHDADFEIKMQIVLHGTSRRLRKRALRDPDYTLADMLIDGRKTETIHAQCSGMESQFQAIQVNNITKKSDSTCYNCGFSYPHKDQLCPARNATCNLCGKHGHFAKVCRSKVNGKKPKQGKQPADRNFADQPSKPRPKSRRRPKQHARHVRQQVSSSSGNSSDDDYVYAIKNKNGDPRTKVTVQVNNVPIKFTVDTGATIDLIDSHTYQQLQHKITLRKSHTKYILTDQTHRLN